MSYKYLLCACLVVFWDSEFSLLYFAQSCSELDLRALLHAFFLHLDSFLIVVSAQGFVKVTLLFGWMICVDDIVYPLF
jgi:hypothetical protein